MQRRSAPAWPSVARANEELTSRLDKKRSSGVGAQLEALDLTLLAHGDEIALVWRSAVAIDILSRGSAA